MLLSNIDPLVRSQPLKSREESKPPAVMLGERKVLVKELELTAPNKVTREALESAIEQANQILQIYRVNLNFQLHEASGEFLVQVVNSESKEVIREIPPEWLLDMVAQIRDAVGLLVDEVV
ncbi:MAG: flagellar protein FlaG [Desulfotomaculum sp.]|nr:flagellar protein FlaG [Desulfotomaculum sp.]